VQHLAKELKYHHESLVYGGVDEHDFLYCLPDSKEINICREMMDNMGYAKLELGLSAMTKDQLVDSLAYNSLKVCIFWLRIRYFFVMVNYFCDNSHYYFCSFFVWQGLILSKDLKAQKDAKDESYQMAIRKLRLEVITLRNEALEKDKILLSLVERLKSSEAKLSTQVEPHRSEVQDLEKKLGEVTKNFNVEITKCEIFDIERLRVQKMLKSFVKLKRNATMLLQNVLRI
jgi:hypothetical protein